MIAGERLFLALLHILLWKNKRDQHKHSLVMKKRWSIVMIDNRRTNPRKRNFLFVFTEKIALKHFCLVLSWAMLLFQNRKLEAHIYIAKYVMNSTSWWLNIVWILIFFLIYLSGKWKFWRQFTEKTYNCSEAKHMKLEILKLFLFVVR